MGLKNYIQNVPRILKQPSWRASLVRAFYGQPAQSKNEAVLHDTVDLLPVIGDGANAIRIYTNKGNRWQQARDFFIGLIPGIGDAADLVLSPDTNLKQFEKRQEKMGKVETIVTGKWFPNMVERYVGGVKDREIFHD